MGTLAKNLNSTLTLKERLALKRSNTSAPALLLDCSSSMHSLVDYNATVIEPRIEALKKIVKSAISGASKIYSFATHSKRVFTSEIDNLTPNGSTFLLPSLLLMESDSIKHAVVVTDGEISDTTSVIEYLESHPEVKLQIIYIGPKDYKPSSLDQLASLCGGLVDSIELTEPKQLTEKIQLLLGSGNEKGSINL